ncbi:rab-GTPase-TBC domain-containing protein [Mycotypha africana]|uniref:rab-GTPase-TBC domain-containing protein n=1 Tax=Mycotypha africana TaxID=64632 RepID=UPI002300615F|nr:rab-GTPase-TBC domain-containing protein [Mycotypha africana]KAI8984285.1 rab-GTPase-TBC domain-containing protein [Mycotypha africana]
MKRKQRKQRKHTKKRHGHHSYKDRSALENEEFQGTFKINEAMRTKNFTLLREIGRKTGFISDPIRRRVWPFLLHCTDMEAKRVKEGSHKVPHKDEEQVKLDVLRSFNSYPKNIDDDDRKTLEGMLHRVITHVLRLFPSFHYYQGFHDLSSVFILLFGEKYACRLVETVALFFLRDNMYKNMEPVLKQLTILDTLIQLEEIELHNHISAAGVLPYYCLSWVITWCSHDLDDLDKITRLFDLFLSSNPFMVVYFAAAVVLSRRDEVLALPCDNSTIHSFLTKLPKDLDVDSLCQKACELELKYPVYKIQCLSSVALDEESAVNRYEKDFVPIKTLEELNQAIENRVLPILQKSEQRTPIELQPIYTDVQRHQSSTLLQKLLHVNKKDATFYTLLTLGAGVGLVAMFMSNSNLLREWLTVV